MKRIEKIAYHEAGHAVVARVFGIPVAYIALSPPGVVLTRGAALYFWEEDDLGLRCQAFEADAKISLAGPYAQLRRLPARKRKRAAKKGTGWDDDIEHAESSIMKAVLLRGNPHLRFDGQVFSLNRREAAEANRVWKRLKGEVEALVAENWPAIKRVAKALLSCPILLQDELDALI